MELLKKIVLPSKLQLFALTCSIIVIISLTIFIHDEIVKSDKSHKIWYDGWKESIDQLPCEDLKHNMSLEDGIWIKSELYYMYQQRAEELKC